MGISSGLPLHVLIYLEYFITLVDLKGLFEFLMSWLGFFKYGVFRPDVKVMELECCCDSFFR